MKSGKKKTKTLSIKPNFIGNKNQPVSNVEWIKRDQLKANNYNPNHVAPQELGLLAISILKSGWTQPIVIRESNEIVDGFHRWTVSGEYPEVSEMTDGLVPCVRLKNIDIDEQKMATIRHNRARGNHFIVSMANIINDLKEIPKAEATKLLGMSNEEYDRLMQRGNMLERGGQGEFNKAWEPTLEGISDSAFEKYTDNKSKKKRK